jgi:hypothetical protein
MGVGVGVGVGVDGFDTVEVPVWVPLWVPLWVPVWVPVWVSIPAPDPVSRPINAHATTEKHMAAVSTAAPHVRTVLRVPHVPRPRMPHPFTTGKIGGRVLYTTMGANA